MHNMKVIKRNELKAPIKWKRRIICGTCKSILEVEEGDLFRHVENGDQRDGVDVDTVWFSCGACKVSNRICDNGVPMAVRIRLKKGAPSGHLFLCEVVVTRSPKTK